MTPIIEVKSDYDGYFEAWVREWVETKEQSGKDFKHEKIVVTAGPYRQYAMTYVVREKTICLDFYAALRMGWGELSNTDIEAIIELL